MNMVKKNLRTVLMTFSLFIGLAVYGSGEEGGNRPGYFPRLIKSRPVIDGNLNEWQGITPVILDRKEQVESTDVFIWGGSGDLSAKIYLMYDEEALYLACDIIDDIYCNTSSGGDGIWAGDSIQFSFDTLCDAKEGQWYDKNDYEYGLALTAAGPQAWCWQSPRGGADLENLNKVRYQVVRKPDNKGLTYEAVLPWETLKPFRLFFGKLGFNIIVVDDDGSGVKQGIGWTRGIFCPKNPSLYGRLYFGGEGLVGCWKFDEGIGDIAKDSSGKGNHGTIRGAKWVKEGKVGKCLFFDGKNSYVDCGKDASLSPGTGSFSAEFWMKIKPTETNSQFLIHAGAPSDYCLLVWPSKSPKPGKMTGFELYRGSFFPVQTAPYSKVQVSDDKWHHVVGIIDREGVLGKANHSCMFIDGVEHDVIGEYDATVIRTLGDSPDFTIGRQVNGLIDEVRIYKRVLTLEEIRTHYALGKLGKR